MNLQDLKNKEPEDLLKQADTLNIENPSSLRKQDLMFAILKKIVLSNLSHGQKSLVLKMLVHSENKKSYLQY